MLTRSEKKSKNSEPEEVKLDEPQISTNETGKVKVRLTEDLMYLVNKKLKSKDKAEGDLFAEMVNFNGKFIFYN